MEQNVHSQLHLLYIIQPTPHSSLTSIFTWAVFKLRSAVFCDWHVKVVLWCSFCGLIFNIDFDTNLWLSGIGSLMFLTPVVMVFPDPSSHVNWNNMEREKKNERKNDKLVFNLEFNFGCRFVEMGCCLSNLLKMLHTKDSPCKIKKKAKNHCSEQPASEQWALLSITLLYRSSYFNILTMLNADVESMYLWGVKGRQFLPN